VTESLVGTRVHIVGVGGAGMSGLARLLVEMGVIVSGSDTAESPTLAQLRTAGVSVELGHAAQHSTGAQIITWSPAVQRDNVEIASALAHGARAMSRAQMLASLANMSRVIGLTGTHGKTTATSMMAQVLHADGRDPSRLLGADVVGLGPNGHWGDGDLILEVDESYGTFSLLHPFALGILNIEADHLDHYGTLESLETAFAELIDRTTGPVVAWSDDPGVQRVLSKVRRPVLSVGTTSERDWNVSRTELGRRGSMFRLNGPESTIDLELKVIGIHNIANAAVVGVLAMELGVSASAVSQGLRAFAGAPRRFEFRGSWRGVEVYEDYAHLPGEISATLRATRAAGYQRIGVVFQPHRVTRTLNLVEEFGSAFDGALSVVVTDIYTAGEPNPSGVSGEIVQRAIGKHRPGLDVAYCASLDDVPDVLEIQHDSLDVLLLLGAGDVASVASRLRGGLQS
jgi:UDP-N-acetylmuramate--alanine ligase